MLKLCFKLGTLSRTFAILIQSAICEFIRKILYSRNSDWKMQREKKKKKMRKKEPSSCVRAILLKLMFFRSYLLIPPRVRISKLMCVTLTILDPLLYCWLLNFVFGIYIRRLVQMTCSSSVLSFYSRLPTKLSYSSSSTVPTSISKFFLGPLHRYYFAYRKLNNLCVSGRLIASYRNI